MTEQEIEQRAEQYAENEWGHLNNTDDWVSVCIDGYIAGAHSRDKEIEKLQKELDLTCKGTKYYEDKYYNREGYYHDLCEKQRNPWISVEDRLPEKLENDCASDYVLTRMDGPRQIWYMVNRYNYDIKSWEGCNNNTTHWMPIPQLKEA